MKDVIESDRDRWDNIYMEHSVVLAECDLMEMEIEASYDAEVYDSIMNGNASRKGRNRKARQNGKRNADKAKRYHRKDRYHGKGLEPYLYKEDGVIKESIEQVWRDCRMPILDKVHNKFALKAEAREQDYSYNFSKMEIEKERMTETENCMTEDEERILDNHYAVEEMLPNFKKGKYIFLLSYWNGEPYPEDSEDAINRFMGTKTSEGVRDIILDEQRRHFHLPKMETETVHGFEGISFKWDGCYDWDDEERGFTKFTFLYLN